MILAFGEWEIDSDRFELRRAGARVEIEPKALELLACLAARAGRLVTKDELHEALWEGRIVSEAALSTLVKAARHAVDDDGRAQRVIGTEHGRGFRFVAPVTRREEAAPAPARAAGPTIAVLPFRTLSPGPEAAAFADGVTDEVLTGLARFRWFAVLARHTVFAFADRPEGAAAAAAALGADYLVEGEAMLDGARARVRVRLVAAGTGRPLWADRRDVAFGSLFAALDEVAEGIVGAIQPEVLAAEARRAERAAPTDRNAWLLFVRAHALLTGPDRDANAEARRLLLQAQALEPGASRVLGGIAFSHVYDIFYGWTEDAAASFAAAFDFANRAVAASGGAESWAWSALAACRLILRDHDGAQAAADEATARNPNSPLAHGVRALTLAFGGPAEAAIEAARRASRLSPADPRAAIWLDAESVAAFRLGRHEAGLAAAEHATALRPSYPGGWRLAAAHAAMLGRPEIAAEAVRRVRALIPGHDAASAGAALPFRDPADREAYLRALIAAGLPRG